MIKIKEHHTTWLCLAVGILTTTLWWGVSVMGIAHAEYGLTTNKSVSELVKTSKPPFSIALPLQGDKEQEKRAQHVDRFAERDSFHSILVSAGRSYAMMPLTTNRHVKRILNYYQHDIHKRFQRYLGRFQKHKKLVQRIFREHGLPQELGYLSLVESGFNTRALSRAKASGPWQFMKATGRQYGLDVTWYVDERRDPVKSTIAAAQHLRDLYDELQSWPLALAAYNAGESKIKRAIRKSGSRDFWKIRETRYIRQETKDYVPSFIAAVLIASHPSRYGFSLPKTLPYAYSEVLMRKRAHLKAVAKATGISLGMLKELNPELLQNIVPIVRVGYSLKVPVGKGSLVRERYDQIKMWTKLPPDSATWYRVRFGETLDDVARQFGLTKQELRRLNRLKKDDEILWNDRLRLRTDDDSAPLPLETEPSPPPTWYRVHYGDTLKSIAKKFDLSVQTLRRLNNLKKGDEILWNDRLRVRSDEDDDPSLVPKPTPPPPPPTWYRVHFGDTLKSIAKKFGLSVRTLRRFNNLKKGDEILWNDRLRVRADENDDPLVNRNAESLQPTAWYRIRYGDTLSSIAKTFGLSVTELKRLNNLQSDRIRSNDRLRIRPDKNQSPVAFNPE